MRIKSASGARMKKYKRKAQQRQKSVITIARVMSDTERAIASPRRLKLRHGLSSHPRERLIPFTGPSRPSARISTKSVRRESKYKEAIVEIR